MRNNILARGVLGAAIGLLLSLIVGTGISYLPNSQLEGLFAGVVVTGVLFVAVLVLLARTRGPDPLEKWLFNLHSILGLVTGVLLAVIVFSGVLLLFRGNIDTWSHDWLRVQPNGEYASVDTWLEAVAEKSNLHNSGRIDIVWPTVPTQPAEIRVSGPEGVRKFHVDPYRARLLEGELSAWMDWIRELHTSLHLKFAGSVLAGLTGLAATWLVTSGLLMRRSLFRDWRILRFGMGSRIIASDLHKRVATWLFPFVGLIVFTGMLLAFFGVLSAGPVRLLFNGGQNEMYAALGYPQYVSRSEQVPMPALEPFTQKLQKAMPDASISEIRVIGFGDRNAIVSIRASRSGDLVPRGASLLMNFRAMTNDTIQVRRIDEMGIFERLYLAMVAIHVADFDEPAIRMLYAGASAGLLLLPFLGITIWVLRRRESAMANRGKATDTIR